MTAETAYIVCNLAVVPGWLLLIFTPRWRPSAGLVAPVAMRRRAGATASRPS